MGRDYGVFVRSVELKVGQHPLFAKFSSNLIEYENLFDPSPGDEEVTTLQANILFHMYNMYQNNSPVYYITPQLAVELAKTDLNVDTDFIISPFREIFVQIDKGLFTISDHENKYPVDGFYVYFIRHETGTIELRVVAVAVLANEVDRVDDSIFYYRLVLGQGKIKDQVEKHMDSIMSLENKEDLIRFGGRINVDHVDEFTYFVINVLLYITSRDPDLVTRFLTNFDDQKARLKSTSKIRKLESRRRRYTEQSIIIVGSKLKLNSREFEDVKSSGGIGGWKLKHRIKVSAHWRTQWVGSTKDDTRKSKLIRVEAYDKGPDAAEYINKTRVVV